MQASKRKAAVVTAESHYQRPCAKPGVNEYKPVDMTLLGKGIHMKFSIGNAEHYSVLKDKIITIQCQENMHGVFFLMMGKLYGCWQMTDIELLVL